MQEVLVAGSVQPEGLLHSEERCLGIGNLDHESAIPRTSRVSLVFFFSVASSSPCSFLQVTHLLHSILLSILQLGKYSQGPLLLPIRPRSSRILHQFNFANFSPDAVDILVGMLTPDPARRMGLFQVRKMVEKVVSWKVGEESSLGGLQVEAPKLSWELVPTSPLMFSESEEFE